MVLNERNLEEARIALNNAITDPYVSMTLAAYGYDAQQLQTGLALYEQALAAINAQGDARISKANAMATFYNCWQEAKAHYTHDLQVVRLVLQEDSTRYFNKLSGKQEANYEKWHAQAKEFYHRLATNTALQALVQQWGITEERIQSGVAVLERLDAARLQQHTEKGNAKATMNQRDEALQALKRWMATFRSIARIALASSPSHLLILGLQTSSYKAPKKDESLKIEIPGVIAESFAAVAV